MTKQPTTRFSISTWVRTVSSALAAVVLAILVVQMAVPTRLAAADVLTESQEFGESGEPIEESETDGEQVLLSSSSFQTVRSRQSAARLFLSQSVGNCPRCAPTWAISRAANELRNRNGIGGPLRC
jgi:hypothetical protein